MEEGTLPNSFYKATVPKSDMILRPDTDITHKKITAGQHKKILNKIIILANQIQQHIKRIRYADDTTLMAESEEELKSLLMKVKKLA